MKNGWGVKRDRMKSLFRLGEGKRKDEAKLTFLVEKGMNREGMFKKQTY